MNPNNSGRRPQEWHADLGLIDDDRTTDLRGGGPVNVVVDIPGIGEFTVKLRTYAGQNLHGELHADGFSIALYINPAGDQ